MQHPKQKQYLSSIVRQYGLQAKGIHSCRTLYKKNAAYRVSTDKGPFLLKPFIGAHARLNQVFTRTAWLKKHSFSSMPLWLTTLDGKHSTAKNGRLYYVTEWIDGSQLGGNELNYEKLGEVLAQLHLVSRRRSPGEPSFTTMEINRFQRQHRMFSHHLPAMRQGSHRIGKWLRKQGDQCLTLAEAAWKTLRQPEVQRKLGEENPSLIHGDVTIPNVIVNRNDIYLVDWEHSRRGSAYYEVAKTLNNTTNFSIPHMKALLAGYEKHCPLTKEERLIIVSLYRLPREAWIAARQFRLGEHVTHFCALEDTWERRMEGVRWLEVWAEEGAGYAVGESH